jgi:hypothetical protein
MKWLLLIVLLTFLIYGLSRLLAFLTNPQRRLKFAQKRGTFYLFDKKDNIRMNLLLTYKGHLLEGEKYASAKEVDRILLLPSTPYVTNMSKQDKAYIEQSLLSIYPKATIDWTRFNKTE